MTESKSRYIVIRPAAGVEEGVPEVFNGEWIERSELHRDGTLHLDTWSHIGSAQPTGRFESAPDGSVAEVYEVIPDDDGSETLAQTARTEHPVGDRQAQANRDDKPLS